MSAPVTLSESIERQPPESQDQLWTLQASGSRALWSFGRVFSLAFGIKLAAFLLVVAARHVRLCDNTAPVRVCVECHDEGGSEALAATLRPTCSLPASLPLLVSLRLLSISSMLPVCRRSVQHRSVLAPPRRASAGHVSRRYDVAMLHAVSRLRRRGCDNHR